MKKIFTAFFAMAIFAAVVPAAYAQAISSVQARNIAVSMAGGGSVTSLEMVADASLGQLYRIVVTNGPRQYHMSISAASGDVLSLNATALPGSVQPVAGATPRGSGHHGYWSPSPSPSHPHRGWRSSPSPYWDR
ncbi:MAG: PepSY domain-containing protein [Treponema sp.]|nr:PepSY domain-containing protein [Treponema sp.]